MSEWEGEWEGVGMGESNWKEEAMGEARVRGRR